MKRRDVHREQEILTDSYLLHEGTKYAEEVIGGRWPEWETAVLSQGKTGEDVLKAIVRYATTIIGGRWHEAEPILLKATCESQKNCYSATAYAREVLKERWKQLEAIILQGDCGLWVGILYVLHIIGGRWPDFEELLMGLPPRTEFLEAQVNYAKVVVCGRWDRLEHYLRSQPRDADVAIATYDYAKEIIGGKWQDGEDQLSGSTEAMLLYAEDLVKGRLPDHLHSAMVMSDADEHARKYFAKYGI